MNLNEAIAIVKFLGNDITDDQASRLMDQCKQELSIADLEVLKSNIAGPMYTELSMHEGEMGGYWRY